MPIDAKLLLAIESNHFAERELNLESREIDDADAEKLATALKKNIHVKSVNLSDNPIRDVGIKALTAVKQLEEMDISQTLISAAGAVELEKMHLIKLNISGTRVGVAGLRSIVKMQDLTELEAEGCEITNEGFEVLTASESILTKLKVGHNLINEEGLKDIGNNKVLTELSLRCMCLTSKIAPLILENETLQTLDLSTNILGDPGAGILAKHRSIQHLDLSQNSVGDAGLAAFADNSQLKELILFGNIIGSDGVNQLAASKRSAIVHLNLCSNRLDDNCALALASFKLLERLDASINNITDAGAKVLQELRDSTSLQDIDLCANPLQKSMLLDFNAFSKKSKQLRSEIALDKENYVESASKKMKLRKDQ